MKLIRNVNMHMSIRISIKTGVSLACLQHRATADFLQAVAVACLKDGHTGSFLCRLPEGPGYGHFPEIGLRGLLATRGYCQGPVSGCWGLPEGRRYHQFPESGF